MPKWAEDGTQIVTPPDAKIERGFTRGQGVSVGHLNWALSQTWENFYDPYPNVFQVVAGDLTATHSGTPVLPGVRFGYDSSSGGIDFFTVGAYTAGTAAAPTGTLSAILNYTKAGTIEALQLNSNNITATFDTGGLLLGGPTTAFNSENTIIRSQTLLTGGSLSATHGFEAGSKRVNTADNAADKRRYAYPTADPLEIEINLSPTLGGWTAIQDVSSTAPNAVGGPTITQINGEGYLVLTRPSSAVDYAIRTPLPIRANKESNVAIHTLTGIAFDCKDSACDTITVEVIRVEKAATVGSAPTQAVVASATSTPNLNHQRVTATVNTILTPSIYQYFVQVRAVETTSGASTALIRDVTLTLQKVAVE